MTNTGRPQAPLLFNPRADRVRDVAKLAGRPVRSRRREFLAEGPQAVREALRSHRERTAAGDTGVVVEIYVTDACLQRQPELAELLDLPRGAAAPPWWLVTEEVLAAMADTVVPQGIIAVCRQLPAELRTVLAGGPRLVAVLARVQDPGNAGTILRAADSAGADAVVLTAGSVDIYNPKAVRATAGSLFHLPVVTGQDFAELAAAARGAGMTVLAADGYGSEDLDRLQDASAQRRLTAAASDTAGPRLEEPTLWVFGNEAQGLDQAELAAADHRVAVPLYGQAESLNVGTAATVCLYASARSQRGRRT